MPRPALTWPTHKLAGSMMSNDGMSRSKSSLRHSASSMSNSETAISSGGGSGSNSSKSNNPKLAQRQRKRPMNAANSRIHVQAIHVLVTPLLHLVGSSLGVVQLWRLHHIIASANARHGHGHAVLRVKADTDTDNKQHNYYADLDRRPEGSTRPTRTKHQQTTLFPPYMFYTAKNITQAEMDSKEFRTHCSNLNPQYELINYDDDMSRRFVSKYYPEWLELYDGLDVPVMRADMWRYLILHKYGGIYLDGDVACKKPIDTWADVFNVQIGTNHTAVGAMVGIEYRRPLRPSVTGGKSYPDKFQVAQWTMAGQPGHYIYYRVVELINQTITHIRSGGTPPGDAVYITGPVQFSHAVVDYMLQRGRIQPSQIASNPRDNHDILIDDESITIVTDELIGDMALLHEDAFSFRGRSVGPATSEVHHTVYARHWYHGGWKTKGWKKMSERDAQMANLRLGGSNNAARATKDMKNRVVQIKRAQRITGQAK